MGNRLELIHKSIFRDMSDGVMIVGFDGTILEVNPAAAGILGKTEEDLAGKKFYSEFFEYQENDAFNQAVLDAVYDANISHKNLVPYHDGQSTKQLHVTTSFLKNEEEKVGIIVVLRDISELAELRDAVKAMERIKLLNVQLELRNKLLSETFGRFLSDEIVKQLLETPDGLALGGKKRTLTVMMSDLRGFTAMSERMEAQSLITMLNHYLGEMTEIIQKHNGTIIEFIGDGIMAIFGAPAPSERHAADAVAAAVEMEARMGAVNEWNETRGYPVLQMGIGLNTGEVIVGNIGSEKRTKYGVVGNHVNLCGRIESYTVGGQILISPMTREMVSEPLEIAGEQNVFPKGAKEPMVLSHVTGIGGEFQLYCENCTESLTELKTPERTAFYRIHEKHIDRVPFYGMLTALSAAGAEMETEEDLEVLANLQLDLAGTTCCKVMRKQKNRYTLRFTSVSPEFEQWLEEQMEKI